MQTPAPAPPRVVEADGTVNVGWFDGPIADVNIDEAPFARMGGPWRHRWGRYRLKAWQYVSVVTPRVFLGCAVVQVGYAGTAFAYVVDRSTGTMTEWRTMSPLGRDVRVARSSMRGRTAIARPGFGTIAIESDLSAGRRRLTLALEGSLGVGRFETKKPPLKAEITIHDDGRAPQPICVVEACGPRRWLYTHKVYGLAAEGVLRCGALREVLAPQEALAGLDHNRGYRPRETWWNWAAAAGHDTEGRRIGFNLTAHRPWRGLRAGAGHGAPDDAQDGGVWLDDRLVKIRRVDFDYDPEQRDRPWHITDDEGLVDLRFVPQGERHEDLNLGLVASRFRQPYGLFEGRLATRDGETRRLEGVMGVTEQHHAVW